MSVKNNKSIKKRLMFITNEDYYFFTYNILFLLKELKCDGKPKKFKDYRKLAFLVEFITDKRLLKILDNAIIKGKINNSQDMEAMNDAWRYGSVRVKMLVRLLQALEKKGIIGMDKDDRRKVVSIWYNENDVLESFFNEEGFEEEKQNSKLLKKIIRGLANTTFETLENNLFTQFGINSYGISSY